MAKFLLILCFVISPVSASTIDTLRANANAGDAKGQFRFAEKVWYHFFKRKPQSEFIGLDWKRATPLKHEARRYCRAAAAAGNANAQLLLGKFYEIGFGGPKDFVKARAAYEHGVKRSDPESMFLLARLIRGNLGGPLNGPRASKLFQAAAEAGHPAAQYTHAMSLIFEKELEAGLRWLQKSAKNRNADANNELGFFYLHGRHVQVSAQKAFHHFQAASNYGLAEGSRNYAICFLAGCGVKQDEERALKLFYKAAREGSNEGAYAAAMMRLAGIGCKKSSIEAIKLLELASHLGHPTAHQDATAISRNLNFAAYGNWPERAKFYAGPRTSWPKHWFKSFHKDEFSPGGSK